MGNETTKNQLNIMNSGKSYRISHQILENSEVLVSKNIMKTPVYNLSQPQIKKWISIVQHIHENQRQYFLISKSIKLQQLALFSQSCSLTLFFDCYPYLLMDQIRNRKGINLTFQEQEIWYVLWALLSAEKVMFRNYLKLGDIRPHNIVFNQTGEIKIISCCSWPKQYTNFLKTKYLKSITFLSPEQLSYLGAGQQRDMSRQQMSQSFSIGLTLLCLIRVQDMSYLYENDQQYYGINFKKLNQLLNGLDRLFYWDDQFKNKKQYSNGLIFVIKKLCQYKMEERLSVSQLWGWLQPYGDDIVNFKKFNLQEILENLSKQKYNHQIDKGSKTQNLQNLSPKKSKLSHKQDTPKKQEKMVIKSESSLPFSFSAEKPRIIQPRMQVNQSPLAKHQMFIQSSRVYPYNSTPYSNQASPQQNPQKIQLRIPPQIANHFVQNPVFQQNDRIHHIESKQNMRFSDAPAINPISHQHSQFYRSVNSISVPHSNIHQNRNFDHIFNPNFQNYPIFSHNQHQVPILNAHNKIMHNVVSGLVEAAPVNEYLPRVTTTNMYHTHNSQILMNKNMISPSKANVQSQTYQSKMQIPLSSFDQSKQTDQDLKVTFNEQKKYVVNQKEKKNFAQDAQKLISKIDRQLNKSKNLFPDQ